MMNSKTCCLLLTLSILVGLANVRGQDQSQSELGRGSVPVEPQTEAFKVATDAFRQEAKKLSETAIRFHVGTGKEERMWKEKFGEIYSKAAPLFVKMMHEGAKELVAAPEPRPNLERWLFTTLQQEIDADRFDGLVPVLEILVNKYPEATELHRMMGMIAVMTCEYDKARGSMEFLLTKDEFESQMNGLLSSLDELKADYQVELAAQDADRSGAPLPTAIIKTTRGNIEVELFENQAPETVANFIYLAEMGVYENTPFHSGKQHFLVQGGGDDVLEPPYKIYGEMKKPGARDFYRGTLGMAISGSPDSAYSQFFFSLIRNPEMDGEFTAFGRVTKGIELVAAITKIDPDESKEKKKEKPKQIPDEILEVEITSKRDHEYLPNKAQ